MGRKIITSRTCTVVPVHDAGRVLRLGMRQSGVSGAALPSVQTILYYGIAPGNPVETTVFDAAGDPSLFDLDECGFQLTSLTDVLHRPASWEDRATVAAAVYPAAENVARRLLGASVALAFHHRVRRSTGILQEAPVFNVHTDMVLGKGRAHVSALLKPHIVHTQRNKETTDTSKANDDERFEKLIDKLLEERIVFVNVWLPLSDVLQEPLAVCDWRTRPVDLSDWRGAEVEWRSSHRWHYFSGMCTGDALVFKQWDSSSVASSGITNRTQEPGFGPLGPAREALHTAFTLPNAPVKSCPRESCEVRVLCLFSDILPASVASAFRSHFKHSETPEYNIFV